MHIYLTALYAARRARISREPGPDGGGRGAPATASPATGMSGQRARGKVPRRNSYPQAIGQEEEPQTNEKKMRKG